MEDQGLDEATRTQLIQTVGRFDVVQRANAEEEDLRGEGARLVRCSRFVDLILRLLRDLHLGLNVIAHDLALI